MINRRDLLLVNSRRYESSLPENKLRVNSVGFLYGRRKNMYCVVRSPRGGKVMSSLWAKLDAVHNLLVSPRRRPVVSGDFLCWRLGYTEKEMKPGDPIYIRRSDLECLKKIMGSWW